MIRERFGWLLGTLAFWGVWAFLPKLAVKHLGSESTAFGIQSIGAAVGAICVWLATREAGAAPAPSFRTGAAFAIGAGLCGAAGLLFYLRALSRDNVAVVAGATALYPLVAALLGWLVLGETLSLRQAIGMGLATVALVLVSDPR